MQLAYWQVKTSNNKDDIGKILYCILDSNSTNSKIRYKRGIKMVRVCNCMIATLNKSASQVLTEKVTIDLRPGDKGVSSTSI